MSVLFFGLFSFAQAADIEVNTTNGDIVAAGDTFCSLAEAIQNANSNTDTTAGDCAAGEMIPVVDRITFNIPGTGVQTITVAGPGSLPNITESLDIDGITQPLASCGTVDMSDRNLLIEIDAGGTPSPFSFSATANNSSVRGISVYNVGVGGEAVSIDLTENFTITCSHIGVDAAGTSTPVRNQTNGVGGGFLGTTLSNVVIGGSQIIDGNIISGNEEGVSFPDRNVSNILVQNNIVGTDITKSLDLGNYCEGISFGPATGGFSDTITILDNVVGFNGNAPVWPRGCGTSGKGGIQIERPDTSNLVEFTQNLTIARNTIYGSGSSGLLIRGITGGEISNNIIGLDVFGNSVSNAATSQGIAILISSDVKNISLINNIISGNTSNFFSGGIIINSTGQPLFSQSNITIQGNKIGVAADGVTPAFNNPASVGILNVGSLDILIGSNFDTIDDTLEANIITGHATGIQNFLIQGMPLPIDNVSILGNQIFDNNDNAIDHVLDTDIQTIGLAGFFNGPEEFFGPNVNDIGDGDSGANDHLNYPVIYDATISGADIFIDYYLDVPAGDYRIEFYRNDTFPATTLHGEGKELVYAETISHTGNGVETFGALLDIDPLDIISATATEVVLDSNSNNIRDDKEAFFTGGADANANGVDDAFELTGDDDLDGIYNSFDVDKTGGHDGNVNGIDDRFDAFVTGGADSNGNNIDDYFEQAINHDLDTILDSFDMDYSYGFGSTSEFGNTIIVESIGADYGDAPDTGTGTGTGNYQTNATDNGPYHIIAESVTTYLGSCVDANSYTVGATPANGDDLNTDYPVAGTCTTAGDDEDGIIFTSPFTNNMPGQSIGILPHLATSDNPLTAGIENEGELFVWIDFNQNGDFEDAGELVWDPQTDGYITSATTSIMVDIPDVTITGPTPFITYARFRFNTRDINGANYPLQSIGESLDGEVEDYQVTIITSAGSQISGQLTDTTPGTPNPYPDGVVVELYIDNGIIGVYEPGIDTLIASQVTFGGTGLYSFTNLPEGNLLVQPIAPTGYDTVAVPVNLLPATFETVDTEIYLTTLTPPTVTPQSTTNTTPTITGTYDGVNLNPGDVTITIDGVVYTDGDSGVTIVGGIWSVDLSVTAQTLTAGSSYEVTVDTDNGAGLTASDATSHEITITLPSSGGGGGSVNYACTDPEATNYDDSSFVRHKQSLCEYHFDLVINKIGEGTTTANETEPSTNDDQETTTTSIITCPYFLTYLKKGDIGYEVAKLQDFLNKYMGATLIVDGDFGKTTKQAVKNFQEKHRSDILDPWNLKHSTGYWYKTSQGIGNEIVGCEVAPRFLEDVNVTYSFDNQSLFKTFTGKLLSVFR
ncbi:peptidoglycan-binding protein [Candidatus Nomurabacteria bacterium]|nr:peptidoglycan-binding protein [Candidatus Nomurabacteria bacterium]